MRACMISNNPKRIYQLSTSKYQAYIDVNNMSKQDINISELRERDEQSQTPEIYFEVLTTCSMSPPSPL